MDEKKIEPNNIIPLTHEERLKLIYAPPPRIDTHPSQYLGNSLGIVSVRLPYKD